MKILVLSDIHSMNLNLNLCDFDYIICAGDIGNSNILDYTNYVVKGNCDSYGNLNLKFQINNKNIFLTHGHLYNVKNQYNSLIYKAKEENANICIFGHTHYQESFIIDDILFINPGAYMDLSYVIIDEYNIYYYKFNKLVKKEEFIW